MRIAEMQFYYEQEALALAEDLAARLGLEGEGFLGLWQRYHVEGPISVIVFYGDYAGYKVVIEAQGEDPWDMLTSLAMCLPVGPYDPQATAKYHREREEFFQALEAGDGIGSLLELGDVCYYLAKLIYMRRITEDEARSLMEDLAICLGCTFEDALAIALVKYTLRARPGNPKDDKEERAMIQKIMQMRGKKVMIHSGSRTHSGIRLHQEVKLPVAGGGANNEHLL